MFKSVLCRECEPRFAVRYDRPGVPARLFKIVDLQPALAGPAPPWLAATRYLVFCYEPHAERGGCASLFDGRSVLYPSTSYGVRTGAGPVVSVDASATAEELLARAGLRLPR